MNKLTYYINKNVTTINTISGLMCVTAASILAIKQTPKAICIIKNRKEELQTDKLPVFDIVKSTGKLYLPSAILYVIGTSGILSSNVISAKRLSALAAICTTNANELHAIKNKVVETVGETTKDAISNKVIEEKIKDNPPSNSDVINTGRGNTLCLDYTSGRYFRSDINKIKQAINECNARLLRENYILLNEFYYEIGLPHTLAGSLLGFNVDKGLIEPEYSSHPDFDSGEVVFTISFDSDQLTYIYR